MPKVKKEKAKRGNLPFITSNPAKSKKPIDSFNPVVKEHTRKEKALENKINPTGKWKEAAEIIAKSKGLKPVPVDIVSAPVLLEKKSDPVNSEKSNFILSKKEKAYQRKNKWLSKLEHSKTLKKADMKKKSRQTIKSALIRGLDELKEGLDSINTISTDTKKNSNITKVEGNSFKIAGNPAKRTRNANKSVLGEMDRNDPKAPVKLSLDLHSTQSIFLQLQLHF
ncbi:hypothetical protein AYI70_g3531 [Smittium culicis]|uniref:Ribosome biogenesis protein SLX9 n=1 Tax=Smittium culicis TaxID=133412 RepID=A0A1R1Y3C8_9FUNG|nr:hypothetical protein AYI70_g3531 [Smittium culicis]